MPSVPRVQDLVGECLDLSLQHCIRGSLVRILWFFVTQCHILGMQDAFLHLRTFPLRLLHVIPQDPQVSIYRLLDFSQCYFVGEFPLNFIPHMSDVKLAACCHWWPLADKLPPVRRAFHIFRCGGVILITRLSQHTHWLPRWLECAGCDAECKNKKWMCAK